MSTEWCRGFGAAFVRVPLFSPKPCTICWCTGQPSFCLPFGFYFSLGCFHWFFALSFVLLLRQGRGICVVVQVVVPPVFPFFSSCLPCPFVFCLFSFCLLLCLLSAFITSSFLLRICVYICLFCWFLFLEVFLCVKKVCLFFPLFYFILIFVLGAKVSKCISESFGRSGYIPCIIGKDGGFIRRDRSFHLPRINLAKAWRCVTDTL